jgi:hypothetical protein
MFVLGPKREVLVRYDDGARQGGAALVACCQLAEGLMSITVCAIILQVKCKPPDDCKCLCVYSSAFLGAGENGNYISPLFLFCFSFTKFTA